MARLGGEQTQFLLNMPNLFVADYIQFESEIPEQPRVQKILSADEKVDWPAVLLSENRMLPVRQPVRQSLDLTSTLTFELYILRWLHLWPLWHESS